MGTVIKRMTRPCITLSMDKNALMMGKMSEDKGVRSPDYDTLKATTMLY